MANAIDILIRAIWQGGPQTTAAQKELQNLGNTVSQAGIEFAAMQARSRLLQTEMGKLATDVAKGNLTVDEAREKYSQFAGSLATFEVEAQKTGLTTAQLVSRIGTFTIVAGTATIAAKKLFDSLERGAGLELTAQRFDRLAQSIGTTGNALRADLVDATEGMLSSAQAMALATDLIGLGLANTEDTAVRLARVVTELDADIGELTLALANQTTRRFDQLGISLQGFDERLNALKGTMSDEEAFTMAFLEQAEAQIERVGGAADTTAGDIRRVQADIAQLREELDQELAREAAPFLADLVGRTSEGLRKQTEAALESSDSIDDLADAYENLAAQADELRSRDPIAFALFNAEAFDEAAADIAIAIAQVSTDAEDFQRNLQRVFGDRFFIQELDLQVASLGEVERAFEHLTGPVDAHEQAMIRNDAAMRAAGEGTREFASGLLEIEDVLQRVQVSLDVHAQQLAAIEAFEARREGIDARSLVAEQQQEQLALDFELLQDRADLFQDFQADISSINQREEEQRLQIVDQYEARRTDLVESYNQRRLDEEADFQRRQARQDAQLARDIEEARSDSVERQAQLREDANRRLEELEEEHLDRMAEIVADADLQLTDAASRLDARAVANIERQRDRALQQETERYQEQRADILEELDRRLELEREAAEQRIEELQEFHARRQREEEEDRRIRLQRMKRDHEAQLRELKKQEDARLQQLKAQAQRERNERERQYTEERFQLRDHWEDKAQLEAQWMNTILEQEELFWEQRLGLVGGGSAGGVEPSEQPDNDDTGGGTSPTGGDQPWSRFRMEHTALQVANPSTSEAAFAWQRYFRSLSDAQLAAWIEQHSNIDVPGFALGGDVARDLFALVGEHGPELVRLPGGSHVFDAPTSVRMMGGVQTGNISITVNEARRPGQTGKEVRDELIKLLNEVSA